MGQKSRLRFDENFWIASGSMQWILASLLWFGFGTIVVVAQTPPSDQTDLDLDVEATFFDGLDRYFELWPDRSAIHCQYRVRQWEGIEKPTGEPKHEWTVGIAMDPRGLFRFEIRDREGSSTFWIDESKQIFGLVEADPTPETNPNREAFLTDRFGPRVAEFFWPYSMLRYSRGWHVGIWKECLEEDDGGLRFIHKYRAWEHSDWTSRGSGFQLHRRISRNLDDDVVITRRFEFQNVKVEGFWVPEKATMVQTTPSSEGRARLPREATRYMEAELIGPAAILAESIEPVPEAIVLQKAVDPNARTLPASIMGIVAVGDINAPPSDRPNRTDDPSVYEVEDPNRKVHSVLLRTGIGGVIMAIGFFVYQKLRGNQREQDH